MDRLRFERWLSRSSRHAKADRAVNLFVALGAPAGDQRRKGLPCLDI